MSSASIIRCIRYTRRTLTQQYHWTIDRRCPGGTPAFSVVHGPKSNSFTCGTGSSELVLRQLQLPSTPHQRATTHTDYIHTNHTRAQAARCCRHWPSCDQTSGRICRRESAPAATSLVEILNRASRGRLTARKAFAHNTHTRIYRVTRHIHTAQAAHSKTQHSTVQNSTEQH